MKKIYFILFFCFASSLICFSILFKDDPLFLSPIPSQTSVLETLKPRLEEPKNSFFIQNRSFLIRSAKASSPVEEAHAYLVVDYDTGEVLAEKNFTKKLPIASLTKIMTAVVALDLNPPEAHITISQNAAEEIPTKIGVVPGQKITTEELLQAVLLTSANDAAEAIKDGIDHKYGIGTFIKAMNVKARHLGLKKTHFDNVQGFDSRENYSTAEDLAVLSHYAVHHYPRIEAIVKKSYAFLASNENHKQFDLYNWNGLIDVYPNTTGVKIGNTKEAGTTSVVISERQGKKIIAVLLGAPGVVERDLWIAELLDLGFEELASLPPVKITKEQLLKKYSTWKYFN